MGSQLNLMLIKENLSKNTSVVDRNRQNNQRMKLQKMIINLQKARKLPVLWFMPVNVFLTFLIGSLLGWLVYLITRPLPHLWGPVTGYRAAGQHNTWFSCRHNSGFRSSASKCCFIISSCTSRGDSFRKAEDDVSSLLAKGYVLSKCALDIAKSFDERHRLTRSTSEKIASIDKRIGFSEKVIFGASVVNGKVQEVDQKLQV